MKGVPQTLAERWSARTADIEKAARDFRTRYGRDPRAGELGSITQATRGTKTQAQTVNVDAAWRAVGEEHGLTHEQARGACTPSASARQSRRRTSRRSCWRT